jgi:transposase InsO family protein
MPWSEVSVKDLRQEFVVLARGDGANVRRLCQRFGISRTTGYKWLARYDAQGEAGLADRSRRPHHSPGRTSEVVEAAVLAVRTDHPSWGGRKIRTRLHTQGHADVPAPSTITAILDRHGALVRDPAGPPAAWQRFEQAVPNALWQMDFKGHFALASGRCHPLTILDDHSRYALGLVACGNERTETVQAALTRVFRHYGLPATMITDNGAPWGSSDRAFPFTTLSAWLIRLGIRVAHARPHHPQTLGKDERFHRTLKAEVVAGRIFPDLAHCQRRFDAWRTTYNLERPHEALGMAVPAQRYQPSARAFPEGLPRIDYGDGAMVRKVQAGGVIEFRGQRYRIGVAFRGFPVALRPTPEDGGYDVVFCHQTVACLNLRETP